MARRVRDEFFVKSMLNPDRIQGLDVIVPEAVKLKYTTAPMTNEQLGELITIPPRKKRRRTRRARSLRFEPRRSHCIN